MLELQILPDELDETYLEYFGKGIGAQFCVRWPANNGEKSARVVVIVSALGEYEGSALGMDPHKIKAALERNRDLIEKLARDKIKAGDNVVTLDVGDFPTKA
jgi:hypothetical protein